MKSAGAKVLEFETFGDYQGTWLAKVKYEGKEGWVAGSFGSCSGCDAFQAEFGSDYHDCLGDEYHSPFSENDFRDNCETCQDLKKRLIAFGKDYLDNIQSKKILIAKYKEQAEWDLGADKLIEFLNKN